MARHARIQFEGAVYHVMFRGNNRDRIFRSDKDKERLLEMVEQRVEEYQIRLYLFCFMTNHVHLLITPQTAQGVSLVMRDLGRDYVRRVNQKYRRSGTMWEGRFKSSLVDTEFYCLACYRYIELNPVRANIVPSPGAYNWSSFSTNALGVHKSLITPHECWLALGANDISRRSAYLTLFEEGLEQQQIEDIRYGLHKGLPTGHDRFKRQIEAALSIKLGTGKRGRPGKT